MPRCRTARFQNSFISETGSNDELIYKLFTFYVIIVGHIINFTIVLPVLIYDYILLPMHV